MAQELAKDSKLMLPTVSFSDGFIIKQMNGQPLIEPLANLFSSVLGQDPRVKEVYDVQAYVDRKDTAYANKDKYNGDILASETAYLNESLKTLKTQTNNSFRNLESNGAAYTKTIETLEKSIADGTATPDTQASLDNYKSALSNNNNLLERTKEDLNLLGESVNKTENTTFLVKTGNPDWINNPELAPATAEQTAETPALWPKTKLPASIISIELLKFRPT